MTLIVPLLLASCGEKESVEAPEITDETTTLGPSGGVVESEDGALKLIFPEGALSAETGVSISVLPPAEEVLRKSIRVRASYRLEPAGLTFAEPVRMEFYLPPTSAAGDRIPLVLTGPTAGPLEIADDTQINLFDDQVVVQGALLTSGVISSAYGTSESFRNTMEQKDLCVGEEMLCFNIGNESSRRSGDDKYLCGEARACCEALPFASDDDEGVCAFLEYTLDADVDVTKPVAAKSFRTRPSPTGDGPISFGEPSSGSYGCIPFALDPHAGDPWYLGHSSNGDEIGTSYKIYDHHLRIELHDELGDWSGELGTFPLGSDCEDVRGLCARLDPRNQGHTYYPAQGQIEIIALGHTEYGQVVRPMQLVITDALFRRGWNSFYGTPDDCYYAERIMLSFPEH